MVAATPRLVGVDFTSSPSRRKPITVASGRLQGERLVLDGVDALATLGAFEHWLQRPGPWLGAFDFPFGLPREFVEAQGLGATCADVIAAVRARWPTRLAWRSAVDVWGNGRLVGRRLPHRRTDRAGGAVSTSPLQTRYVPVGFMYYEGLSRLIASGVDLPGLHAGDADRVAVEGYPGRLADALVGRRSYKNSALDDRRVTRVAIVEALEGRRLDALAFALVVADARLRDALLDDDGGDRLDAVLCLVQAAMVAGRADFGVPADVDRVEGWIVGVGRRESPMP